MPGRITFRSETSPPMQFSAWLGEEGAKPTDGYGGWEVITRPRRVGLTQWNGRNPLQMDISILLDGFEAMEEVESDCKTLEQMAFPHGKEPPTVRLFGDMVPFTDRPWVITGIAWGTAIRGTRDGKRVRQEATVTVLSYVAADKVQLTASQRSRKNKGRR
jgi:hypothetical protein